MNIHFRRSLAAVFILVFLVGFLPLILITSGRLYNPKKRSFERTTLLIVESEPKDATILLNGKNPENWWAAYIPILRDRTHTTPERLHYLLPDTYTLRVEKEGYKPFETSVNLEGGQTTIIDSIKLWPNTSPTKILDGDKMLTTISPRGTHIAYFTEQNDLELLTVGSNTSRIITTLEQLPETLKWISNTHLLAVTDTMITLYDTTENSGTSFVLSEKPTTVITNDTNNLQFALGLTSLYPLHTEKNIEEPILTAGFVDAFVRGDELWVLYKNSIEKIIGDTRTLYDYEGPGNLTNVLFNDTAWIYCVTETGNLVRFHKPTQRWQTLNANNVKDITITSEANEGVVHSDFEVSTLFLDSNTNSVATRLSEKILDVIVDTTYPDNHYLIITENRVVALDQIFGVAYQTSTLFNLNGILEAKYNQQTNQLLLVTKSEEAFEIYSYRTDR